LPSVSFPVTFAGYFNKQKIFMPTKLLTTKLVMPGIHRELVDRPRLTGRIDPRSRLTLVAAPAGFGKTTLVAGWLAESGRRYGWLSLDDNDNDLPQFLSYLLAALRTLDPDMGRITENQLQATQLPPVMAIITDLINDLPVEPFVLVLDDYHLIETAVIHEVMAFLLNHQPPQMHLILITREDPPLPLPRLRAKGLMTEIRAQQLRFTPEEAAAFFEQTMKLALTAEQAAALEQRTEGWVAGLQLSALSMQGRNEITAATDRYIVDYLVEEVLQHQPADVQNFLMETSILDWLTDDLCRANRT
jgi:LuxR family transcriptional regulator, maltose regulon positive regulatory protein